MGRGVAAFTGGVAFAGTVGIVVSVAANVGEGAGAVGVGVGECLPGGVLEGFAAVVDADSTCAVSACAFAIPSTAPTQEKRRSKSEHAAIRAREARENFLCILHSPVFFISVFLDIFLLRDSCDSGAVGYGLRESNTDLPIPSLLHSEPKGLCFLHFCLPVTKISRIATIVVETFPQRRRSAAYRARSEAATGLTWPLGCPGPW